MLIHLVIRVPTAGCVWASSLSPLHTFKVLPIHVSTVAVHLHESASLLIKELKLNLVMVGSGWRRELPARYDARVASSCGTHIDLCVLLQGSVCGR